MPSDENITSSVAEAEVDKQNPILEETMPKDGQDSIPPSPQELMANIPINTTGSEPSNMPPEAPEAPKNIDNAVPVNNDNRENSPISTPTPKETKPEEEIEK